MLGWQIQRLRSRQHRPGQMSTKWYPEFLANFSGTRFCRLRPCRGGKFSASGHASTDLAKCQQTGTLSFWQIFLAHGFGASGHAGVANSAPQGTTAPTWPDVNHLRIRRNNIANPQGTPVKKTAHQSCFENMATQTFRKLVPRVGPRFH